MSTPRIEIHSAGDLSAQRRIELDRLFHAQFANTAFQWAPPQWHVLAFVDDTLAACVRVFERTIIVGSQALRVGGIGGVMTLPEWRMRGLASVTLRRAADFMRDHLGVEFALLLCRDEVAPVYLKLGWEFIDGPTSFDQPTGRATYPQRTMVLRCRNEAWPLGPIDLRGLPW